ncbi:chemotaxis protein CheW [Sphaerotilus mobilis]|uniref:Chemotaxis protein CheW n=1 Tax=Sphaerotilus mobilis TaxID=47994 RepID=A0A4Q7LRN3_9BURK|nr:chemotaxis protein CheW [Sphaerotilus mobilis]RZS57151.1 purine-binding chemotaxis protein CheW [Sphaerotilus mobilis]
MSTALALRDDHADAALRGNLAPGDLEAQARAIAENRDEHDDLDDSNDGASQNRQFVTFSVAGEMFAVPMAPVQEIIRVPAVAHLPLAPRTLDGLANLRGRVLPIINLRRLFGCDERANDDATRALVINLGQPLGFVVDRVASVVTIEAGEIESADAIQSIVSADYLTGVIKRARSDGGHDMLLSIDFERLIDGQFSGIGALRGAERGGTGNSNSHSNGNGNSHGNSHGNSALAGQSEADLQDDDVASDELRLVSFSVANQEYALDIAEVQEIVQLPERINALPNTPHHVLGVISLRERLLPLVSLRTLFGLPPLDHAEQHRIVVTSLPGGLSVGLVTDSVKEVLSVPRAQAEPMPGMLSAQQDLDEFSSICRLDGGKRLVSIIATDRLLRMPAIERALDASHQLLSEESSAMRQDRNRQDDADDRADSTDDDTQVVIFRLGAEEFGVPIMSVQEIVRVPEALTRVPRTPAFVEGVINLRGTVLPVIDQRSRLGLPTIDRNDQQRIMVYLIGGMRTGFIVDSVAEVLRIPRGQIVPAPTLSTEQSQLIGRVANLEGSKRLVMLIEPAHLLHGNEMQAMAQQLAAPSAALSSSASASASSAARSDDTRAYARAA